MRVFLGIAAVFGALLVVGGIIIASAIFGAMSSGNRMENTILASYDENRNQLSTYTSMVAEAAQVPAMQRDDLAKVVTAALEGRYGQDGSKAVFQMIQEQNPNIDSSVYTKLQQIIQAGRTDFKMSQDQRIDRCRTYKTEIGSPWNGFWLRLVGYPKIDLKDKCEVVVLGSVNQIFETKTDQIIQLR